MSTPARLVTAARALATLAAMTTGAALAWLLARGPLLLLAAHLRDDGPEGLAGLPVDQVLTGVFAAALLACCGWLLLVSALVVAETLLRGREGPVSGRLCPSAVRRLVLASCGVAIAGGVAAGPATAHPAGVGGLAVPDRTVGRTVDRPAGGAATVTVHVGDCLWSIAERALPPGAGDGRVSAAWHALYHRNVDRIGPDPDLVVPGTVLRLPGRDSHHRRDPQ